MSAPAGTRSVGIGDVSLAIAAARGVDRAGVSRALAAALEAGLELVDIAPEDDSERLAGETIRGLRLRDKAIAAPRVPALRTLPSGAATRDALLDRLPPRYVVSRIESALRATKLDALPLAQLELRAGWRSSSAWPELVDTCARLVRDGKVLAWGAFAERVDEDSGELAREAWLVSLALPFSLCERTNLDAVFATAKAALEAPAARSPEHAHLAAAGLTPELAIMAGMPADLVMATLATSPVPDAPAPKAARETPIAILARRPLAGGALAGTLGPGGKLKQRDDRASLTPAQLERIAVAAATLTTFVKEVPPAARSCEAAQFALETALRSRREPLHAQSLTDLALRYVLTRGATALPRLHHHENVLDAVAASITPPLPPDLVEALHLLDI